MSCLTIFHNIYRSPKTNKEKDRIVLSSAFPHRKTTSPPPLRRSPPLPVTVHLGRRRRRRRTVCSRANSFRTVHGHPLLLQAVVSRCTRLSPAPRVRSGAETLKGGGGPQIWRISGPPRTGKGGSSSHTIW